MEKITKEMQDKVIAEMRASAERRRKIFPYLYVICGALMILGVVGMAIAPHLHRFAQ
jgi:hypothetical protein